MKLQLFSFLSFILLCTTSSFSQQIRGKIIDAKTGEPIAFATIQYDDYKGVISNVEGYFSLAQDQIEQDTVLTISFMGYQSEVITMSALQKQNGVIKLEVAVNQLKTVYLTNKLPNVDSIMARVKRNLPKNYHTSALKQTLFTRETVFFKPNDLEVDIDKSSGFSKKQLDDSNNQFKSLSYQIITNPPTQTFTDVLFDLYTNAESKSKFQIIKATKLKDIKNSLSLETIQSKVTSIVLQHLDTTKTYKVKTGWFKVEDSLSLKKSDEQIVKDDDSFQSLKSVSLSHIKDYSLVKGSNFEFIEDTNYYDYKITNITTIDEQLVYIINFEPRRNRAKFQGVLYVSEQDYAILKMDYSFAEGKVGERLNLKFLLGVKYEENVNRGTVIYKKNEVNASYYPYYINHQSGRFLYASRPFKFIENDDDSKNKVAFNMTIGGDIIEKFEMMSLDNQVSNEAIFNSAVESKKVDFIQLSHYDPTIWKDYSIMEPLEELKKFKVGE